MKKDSVFNQPQANSESLEELVPNQDAVKFTEDLFSTEDSEPLVVADEEIESMDDRFTGKKSGDVQKEERLSVSVVQANIMVKPNYDMGTKRLSIVRRGRQLLGVRNGFWYRVRMSTNHNVEFGFIEATKVHRVE